MDHRVPPRLSPALGRRFGLTVGAVVVGLGLLLVWRQRTNGAVVLFLGVLLVLGGAVKPAWLVPVYRAWMGLGRILSIVVTPVVLGAFYFLVLTPMGWIRRTLGKSPIRSRSHSGRWVTPGVRLDPKAEMRRQF